MKDTLIKKFLKFSYGSWLGLLLGLISTMIVTRLISPDALGKASMFDLFIQVVMVVTIFGTDQAFVRFFYEEQDSKRGALLYNSLRLPVITSLVMILVIILFFRPITDFLFGNESLSLAILIAIGILTQVLLRFSQLVIRMQQKGHLYSLIQIFQKLFYLIFIILFFYFIGSTYEVLILSSVTMVILVMCIAIYYGKEFWSLNNLKVKGVKHSQKEILKFGTPFVLTIFISWLFESFAKIAIRQWSTFDELGLFAAAMRLVALVKVLKSTFSTFWTPVSYERFERQPEDKAFFRDISILVSFAMFLVAIISIAAKELIVALLGSDYSSAVNIMPFLVFMPVLYTISETTVMGINFYKKISWHILIAIVSCAVNIVGNWLLVPEYGAIGASISIASSYVVFFTLRTVISLKYYKVEYPLLRIYFMVLVIAMYATLSITITSLSLNLLIGVLLIILLTIIFYKDLIYIIKNRTMLLD